MTSSRTGKVAGRLATQRLPGRRRRATLAPGASSSAASCSAFRSTDRRARSEQPLLFLVAPHGPHARDGLPQPHSTPASSLPALSRSGLGTSLKFCGNCRRFCGRSGAAIEESLTLLPTFLLLLQSPERGRLRRSPARRVAVTPPSYCCCRWNPTAADSDDRPAPPTRAEGAVRRTERRWGPLSDERHVIGIRDAAALSNRSEDTIRRRILDGTIPGAIRDGDGPNAKWLVPIDGLMGSGLLRGVGAIDLPGSIVRPACEPPRSGADPLGEVVVAQQRTIESLLERVAELVALLGTRGAGPGARS